MKTLALAFMAIVLLPGSVFSQPIEISTPEHLQAINADEASRAGNYILVNDIDLAGIEWRSIGLEGDASVGFAGTFDGNGHIVKNLTTNNEENRAGGLIGKALAGSVVKNVGVVDCNITSKDYSAAVVGDNFGEVSNCFCAGGSVSTIGTGNVGTFCGMSRPPSSITNCYSIGVDLTLLTGSTRPVNGGFIGNAAGSVTNCYYVGGVITPAPDGSLVGGFVGKIPATVTSCYFNLDEGGIATFTSQGTTAEPGGRTTDDMTQESTYVGWDFADIWTIDEGQSYPQLRMFLPPNPKTNGPQPKDDDVIENIFVELTWIAGAGATTNNVYISDDADAVAQGTVEAVETTEASLVVGIPDAPLAPSLTPGMTYYWRVDAVGAETIAGDVWSFSVAPETAYGPSPADGARVIDPNVVLSWKAGLGAIVHYVTVGESFDEVDTAELGLGIEAGETILDIGPQAPGKIIYWRVDELNGETGEFVQGQVWSFVTAISVVDDFEVYKEDPNDPGSISIFDVWLDGFDEALGNGTGAVASNAFEPYAEQDVVHSGAQAMPLNFDNSGQTALGARALYSETSRTFAPAADWSGQTLALWYRGQSQNTAETLSVVITDAGNNSVVIENTAEQNAVQSTMWTEWTISLGDIEGIDLSQVTTLAIRIGDPGAQQAGSKGKINIDDIAIYPQQSVSPIAITIPVPNGDFQLYKPGTDYTVTADLNGNYAQGVGDNLTVKGGGEAVYSDGTTGTSVDCPGWISTIGPADLVGDGIDGSTTLHAFGTWSGGSGTTVVSADSLGNIASGTYTLSAMVNGSGGPLMLDLLVDGVALTPSSSVTPSLPTDGWQEISRTYDAGVVGDYVGQAMTIALGTVAEDLEGTWIAFDAVSLSYAP